MKYFLNSSSHFSIPRTSQDQIIERKYAKEGIAAPYTQNRIRLEFPGALPKRHYPSSYCLGSLDVARILCSYCAQIPVINNIDVCCIIWPVCRRWDAFTHISAHFVWKYKWDIIVEYMQWQTLIKYDR